MRVLAHDPNHRDRVAFVRDGVLGLPERVAPVIDVGRAVRAARALREAAKVNPRYNAFHVHR